MAVAAHRCVLKLTGTAVAMTGEATTDITDYIHQIADSSKRVISPGHAITVYDGASPIAAADYEVDYLSGTVTLDSIPSGVVTVDAYYLPLFSVAEVREFSVTLARNELEDTVMGDTAKSFILGGKRAEGSIGSLDLLQTDLDSGAGSLVIETEHGTGSYHVLEVTLNPDAPKYWRGLIKVPGLDLSAARDGLVESSFPFSCHQVVATGRSEEVSFSFGS